MWFCSIHSSKAASRAVVAQPPTCSLYRELDKWTKVTNGTATIPSAGFVALTQLL